MSDVYKMNGGSLKKKILSDVINANLPILNKYMNQYAQEGGSIRSRVPIPVMMKFLKTIEPQAKEAIVGSGQMTGGSFGSWFKRNALKFLKSAGNVALDVGKQAVKNVAIPIASKALATAINPLSAVVPTTGAGAKAPRKKRVMTAEQKKVMLANLKKGREARAKKYGYKTK